MGNSSSTSKETQRANERAYVRSLGDRYPLGDAELRKWCWCHGKLTSGSSSDSSSAFLGLPAGVKATTLLGPLSAVAVLSTLYGDFNPYVRRPAASPPTENSNKGVIVDRINTSNKVLDAISNVEKYIFAVGLGPSIVQKALGLPSLKRTEYNVLLGESGVDLDEENFYSIASSVKQYLSSREDAYSSSQSQQGLEDFLEGVSTSCGRRGSRASLSKLFVISISHNNANQPERLRKAEASIVIRTAYCLTLAASYLRNVAATVNRDATDFVPQTDPKEMQSMVDSLLESAKKQRRDGGGGGMGGGNFAFDYSYGANTNTSNSSDTNETTMISLDEFLEWAETTVPMIASALPTFLQVLFTFFTPATGSSGDNENNNEPRFPPGVTPLWMPYLTVEQSRHSTHSSPTSSFFHSPTSSSFDLFFLCTMGRALASGRWHRLFSSEANGLSCNRLMHSIIGYGGPTIIIIRSKDSSDKGECSSGMFGAYTHSAWSQEASSFYGNSDCFLFRLGPDPLAVYRPKGGDTGGLDALGTGNTSSNNNESSETRNYMYYNPEARSKGYDGLAHGVGFGGTSELPRLYIDEFLDGCRAASEDLTYEKGPLLSGLKDSNSSATSHFEVEAIEAWGVGTSELVEEALLARVGQREDKQKQINKVMKGKGQFLEDLQLTGAKVFQHRDQIRGRDGGCDLDKAEGEEG